MTAGVIRGVRESQGFDFDRLPVVCPAGEKVCMARDGSPGVRCRVEEHTITALKEPSSIAFYCGGDYTKCPSWRAEKMNRLVQTRVRNMEFMPRTRQTILDQDPETVPAFSVPDA